MRTKKIIRKIVRGIIWFFLVVGALLLLLIGLLQLPAVQHRLTGKLEQMLANQLHTEVRIGRMGIELPKLITIEDVFLATPQGDSLFALGKLGINLNMPRLLRKQVYIQDVKVKGLFADVIITDSTSNIQFLLDAFLPTDTTTASTVTTSTDSVAVTPWTIHFPGTTLALENTDVFYQDDPNGLLLDGRLRAVYLQAEDIQLKEQQFSFEEGRIEGGDIFLKLSTPTSPVDTSLSTSTASLLIAVNDLSISSTAFKMASSPLDLDLEIPEGRLTDAVLDLGDEFLFQSDRFVVSDGQYAMDLPQPPGNKGLDYNHLHLRDIQIEAKSVYISPDSMSLQADAINVSEQSGLAIRSLHGKAQYSPRLLDLQNLELTTDQSHIEIPTLHLLYNFQEGFSTAQPLQVQADAQAEVAIADLLYLLPQLDTIELLRQNAGQSLQIGIQVEGNEEQLRLDQATLHGPGINIQASALLSDPTDMNKLNGRLQLDEFDVIPAGILPLLPDSLLPPYIEWPSHLRVVGDARYARDQAFFDLRAEEQRDSTPINSVLEISGNVNHIRAYPNTEFDVSIDTLRATRFSALAYLLPNALPEGYHLPEFLKGKGSIKGPLNQLQVDVNIATASGQTSLSVNGEIDQILKADSLGFDLNIQSLVINIPELREILPDSTLPSDLNFPDFRIDQGRLYGKLDDLMFRLPINTINGDGLVQGQYATDRYNISVEISGFRLKDLYQGARADSLALLDLAPLNFTLESSGRLQPQLDAELSAVLYEGTKGALLNLNGTARGDTFQGEMSFAHNDLQGEATAQFISGDSLSLAKVNGAFKIKRADLQRWRLSDRPLYLSGQASFNTTGLSLDDLSAHLQLKDLLLRSDTSTAFVDTLYAYAEMHHGNNEVEVFSDLLNFSLESSFRPILVAGEIKRFIQAYWQDDIVQPDPVVYGNYLKAYLEIKNPNPLTAGIIPGLRELSPMNANLIYREREPELLIKAKLPLLNYSGIKMDSLLLNVTGSPGKLNYQADWKKINLADQIILGATRFSGGNTDRALQAQLQVWQQEGDLQHNIQLEIDPQTDSLYVKLAPQQVIDHMTWTIPADNRLLFTNRQVSINNWRLSFQGQWVELSAPATNTVALNFNHLDLAPFSRLIRSEEEIVVGVMDGVIKVNNPMTTPLVDAKIDIRDLSIYDRLWGNLSLALANKNSDTYTIDLELQKAANDLALAGTFNPNGPLDLQLRIGALQLQSIEPLSMGYLNKAQGHLSGNVAINGTVDQPRYRGSFQFMDAAIDVSLLQTRFHIAESPIRFEGSTISIDRLNFYDPQNNVATLAGSINATSLSDYSFNLTVTARDFLVMNTTEKDNSLYYGYLRADADVSIGGTIYQPELEITASPKTNSHLTYNLVQNNVPQAESRTGIVRFIEKYEWQQAIVTDSIKQERLGGNRTFSLTTNLNVTPDLQFTAVIDPITGDQFTGRGQGDIVFRQFADGKMEMTGRIEMVEGLYNFTYQGLISRQFSVESGSSVSWQGDPLNPSLDLNISSYIKASPYPLVSSFGTTSDVNLRRQQTFAVRMYLKGTLSDMQVSTDILYPEDYAGNTGLPAIDQSLSTLRTDQSQLNTQAFGLLLFKGFVNFDAGAAPSTSIDNSVQSGLDNVLSQQLNNLANRYINFVELDFGLESFDTGQGGRQRDLRLSLRKRLFNNRLIISVDGVTQTGATDESNTLPQTYLDNLTAEFLLTKKGGLRLKIFSDRELDQFTTGDVVRVGGKLAFSKDFDHFIWNSNKKQDKKSGAEDKKEEDATREDDQIKIIQDQ
ncbi:MAG: translocation/assembly module TamB domain-containing protein [Saprospiraceae bacterium]|nr:translocation/assembly module TamB domain-containing protein [Lewinella sp.]